MQKPLILLIALVALLAGCSNLRFPGVYRIDIPQGNFVTQDMLDQLAAGMSEEQVQYVLGAPTLRDPFTPDTWFYLMTYQPGKGDRVTQDIVVYFENGVFARYEGEVNRNFNRTAAKRDKDLETQADIRKRETEPEQ